MVIVSHLKSVQKLRFKNVGLFVAITGYASP